MHDDQRHMICNEIPKGEREFKLHTGDDVVVPYESGVVVVSPYESGVGAEDEVDDEVSLLGTTAPVLHVSSIAV